MTQEEKAKAYDRVSKEVKDFFEGRQKMYSDVNQTLEYLFPELKESEDEKIRKELIDAVQGLWDNDALPMPLSVKRKDEWLAWLERQGEHANFRNKIQVGDKVTRNEDGMLVNLSQLKRVAKPNEKQGEKKPKENNGNLGEISSNWSEVDEELVKWSIHNLTELKDRYGEEYGKVGKCIDWVKSLKGRVGCKANCTTTKEWSEDDERHKNTIIRAIHGAGNITPIDGELAEDWLKSLRPQSRWKPSDEQICLLQAIINEPNNAASESCQIVLKDILEQLKKLKEGKV